MGRKSGRKSLSSRFHVSSSSSSTGDEIEVEDREDVKRDGDDRIEDEEEDGTEEEEEDEEEGGGGESYGKCVQRHKREIRELRDEYDRRIRSLGKNDKKGKKLLQKEHADALDQLQRRQMTELELVQSTSSTSEQVEAIDEENEHVRGKRKLNERQLRRREKRLEEERVQRERFEEALRAGKSPGKAELGRLNDLLAPLQLGVKSVPPDGNCLYRSLVDQLRMAGLPHATFASNEAEYDYRSLRSDVAEYIRSHAETFIPFLDEQELGEKGGIDEYCDDIRDTSTWGGQLEIQAVASFFEVPVHVFRIDSIRQNPDDGSCELVPLVFGEEYSSSQPLLLSYHLQMYSSGEHYNSIVPLALNPTEEEAEFSEKS